MLAKIIISLQGVYFHQLQPTWWPSLRQKSERTCTVDVTAQRQKPQTCNHSYYVSWATGLDDYVLEGLGSLTFNGAWDDLQEDVWMDYVILSTAKANRFFAKASTSKQIYNFVLKIEEYLENLHKSNQRNRAEFVHSCCWQLSSAEGDQITVSFVMGFNGTLTSLQSKALRSQQCHQRAHTCTTHTGMKWETGGADKQDDEVHPGRHRKPSRNIWLQ